AVGGGVCRPGSGGRGGARQRAARRRSAAFRGLAPMRLAALVLAGIVGAAPAAAQQPDGGRVTSPAPEAIDPGRFFGTRPADVAYGAYQRGYYLTAVRLATPLALEGDPAAQTLIAEIYSRGLGVKPDLATAVEWYEK